VREAVIDQPGVGVKGRWTAAGCGAISTGPGPGNPQGGGRLANSSTALGRALAVLAFLAVSWPNQSMADMQRFQWQNRPLVVIAPAADDPALARQLAIAEAHAEGWRDRDMVTIVVAGDRPVTVDGAAAADLANGALRRRFGVTGQDFAAVLVGKDGTAKLRGDAPITAERLFETIDAMPMRRREMREREGS
jgi:hypothetical protein